MKLLHTKFPYYYILHKYITKYIKKWIIIIIINRYISCLHKKMRFFQGCYITSILVECYITSLEYRRHQIFVKTPLLHRFTWTRQLHQTREWIFKGAKHLSSEFASAKSLVLLTMKAYKNKSCMCIMLV